MKNKISFTLNPTPHFDNHLKKYMGFFGGYIHNVYIHSFMYLLSI